VEHQRSQRVPHRATIESDAALLAASTTDAHAFRLFYDRYSEAIFRYFARRGVDHHAALDLTAETFAASWLSRDRFNDRGDGNGGPWLFGIARNTLSHAARHRAVATAARERLGMLAETRALDPVAVEAIEGLNGLSSELDGALEGLPGSARQAVELRVVHGNTYHEIGESLGCSPLAARVKVSRALAVLRADVHEHDGGDEQ
jgi:RNA polymerase sigma-70 factor (ECF subfamily)